METGIIKLTEQNIANEHICCAIADKKCSAGYEAKKLWLQNQFGNGYVFKKFDIRGKVLIEYVPAEYAWAPVDAPGYMLINCFWVSGKYKGKGYGKALLDECMKDAEGMNGVVVITSTKKQPFMSDKKFFQLQGFSLCDTADPYFELWHKKINSDAPVPKFKDCAKQGTCEDNGGIVVFYTNACPFTEHYTNIVLNELAEERGIPVRINKIESMEQAQNHSVPTTIYSAFYKGKFVTQNMLYKANFDKFIKV